MRAVQTIKFNIFFCATHFAKGFCQLTLKFLHMRNQQEAGSGRASSGVGDGDGIGALHIAMISAR